MQTSQYPLYGLHLVAKLSGSQLQWFGIRFRKTSGYYHPLVHSNAVSKLQGWI